MIIEDSKIINNEVNIKENKIKRFIDNLKTIFSFNFIPYVIVLFFVASVNILNVQPLAYVMLGIAIVFKIPLLIPLIISLLSFIIFKLPTNIIINYGITYILYILFTSIVSIEGISKRYIIFTKLIISVFLASIISMSFEGFAITNIYKYTINLLIIVGMYPVFINGCNVLFNITKKIIFSKEEIVSFIILLAMICMPFASHYIYGVNIVKSILLVLIVLASWQNDWLVGASTGVIIGLIYGIITGDSTVTIIMFIFSGLLAGGLNRFNKIILAVCFIIGNILLLKIFQNTTLNVESIIELGIVFVIICGFPNRILIKIDSIFNNSNSLIEGYPNRLGPASDIKNRLGAISEIFDNLSNISMTTSDETKEETQEVIKKYLIDYKKNECISCKNKKKCLEEDIDNITSYIAERLEKNKTITKEMLPVECSLSEEIINNIQDIYNNIKLMRIVQIKENEANKKMSEEYKSVSNLIKNMSKEMDYPKRNDTKEQRLIRDDLKFMGYIVYEDIYKEEEPSYEFITDILIDIDKAKKDIQRIVSDALHTEMKIKLILNSSKTEKSRIKLVPSNKYIANSVVKQIKKTGSNISGDSYLITELKDNSKIFAISDGMGSGDKSKEISGTIINMIEKLTASGLEKNEIIETINSVIAYKENKNISATLDMCVINEKKDVVEFIKIGASNSYIIKDNNILSIAANNMPIGLTENINYSAEEVAIQKNMFIVISSDGASSDINETVLQEIINEQCDNLTEIELMDEIIEKLTGSQNKIILDDITIIVCKII